MVWFTSYKARNKRNRKYGRTVKGYKIDAAYTSPILRAKNTAQIILKNHSVLLNEDGRLKEVNFGLLEGLPCLIC